YSKKRIGIGLIACPILLLTTSCSKQQPSRGPLIVLRFENLTGNPALDWMSRAASRQIATQLNGATAADSPPRASGRQPATAAGPNFAAPYLALIELSLARKDRAAAERTMAMARTHGAAFLPIARARLDVTAAQLSGDPAALNQSLAALSRVNPADANLLRNL